MGSPVPIHGKEKDPSDTREDLLLLARLALEVQQYDRMFDYMKRLVWILAPTDALTEIERRYFRTACKLVYDDLLSFWLYVRSAAPSDPQQYKIYGDCQETVAREIIQLCCDIVEIIDFDIMPRLAAAAASAESRVIFMTMKGDYLRNQVAMVTIPVRESVARAALEAYESVKDDAVTLPVTNLNRIEFFLHLAIYRADILGSYGRAVSTANTAAERATKAFERQGVAVPEETAAVLRNLQDYVDRWMLHVRVL